MSSSALKRRDSTTVRIALFEVLIESELAHALESVSNESWEPALEQTSDSTFLHHDGEPVANRAILLGIDLEVTLDNVKRCDRHMRQTTGQPPTDRARDVVVFGVHLDLLLSWRFSCRIRHGSALVHWSARGGQCRDDRSRPCIAVEIAREEIT